MNKNDIKIIQEIVEENHLTAYKLSEKVSLSTNTISKIIKNEHPLPKSKSIDTLLKYLVENFGRNEELHPEYTVEFRNQKAAETPAVYQTKGVPYYDVEFAAGFEDFTQNQAINPSAYVVHPFFNGCDYVIRASGQSMAKVIKHGDLIGITKVEDWFEFLPFGEIYAIVTKSNFRMIKVITQGKTADSFTLISKPSENKKDEFPPQEIKKSKILSIFKVQASSYLF